MPDEKKVDNLVDVGEADQQATEINLDDKGEIDQLFPFEKGVSPLLNYQNNDVPIPAENKQMRLDGETGKEYLCLIYSKKAIDFDLLKKQLESQSNAVPIYKRFQACLGNRLILLTAKFVVVLPDPLSFQYSETGLPQLVLNA